MSDPYLQLRKAWNRFWVALCKIPMGRLPQKKDLLLASFAPIAAMGKTLGGSIHREMRVVEKDLRRLLDGKMSLAEVIRFMDQALLVEQETREL